MVIQGQNSMLRSQFVVFSCSCYSFFKFNNDINNRHRHRHLGCPPAPVSAPAKIVSSVITSNLSLVVHLNFIKFYLVDLLPFIKIRGLFVCMSVCFTIGLRLWELCRQHTICLLLSGNVFGFVLKL